MTKRKRAREGAGAVSRNDFFSLPRSRFFVRVRICFRPFSMLLTRRLLLARNICIPRPLHRHAVASLFLRPLCTRASHSSTTTAAGTAMAASDVRFCGESISVFPFLSFSHTSPPLLRSPLPPLPFHHLSYHPSIQQTSVPTSATPCSRAATAGRTTTSPT